MSPAKGTGIPLAGLTTPQIMFGKLDAKRDMIRDKLDGKAHK